MNTKNINTLINQSAWFNRIALFVVYFWFGFLKIIGTSPAEGLVSRLFDETLVGIIPLNAFLPAFGIFECALGLLWLFPKLTKLAFWTMCLHMFSTFLPMILLMGDTWQSFMTLTLTGQYIIKNVVLVASSWFVFQLHTRQTEEQAFRPARKMVREYANA